MGSVKRLLTVILLLASTIFIPDAFARENETLLQTVTARRVLRVQRASPMRLKKARPTVIRSFRERRKLARERRHSRPTLPTLPTVPPVPLAKTQPNQKFVPSTPLPSLNAGSHFLLLGEKGPVIATIKVTPQDEPVHVRTVQITLTAEVSSVSSLEVFDEFGFHLGVATLDLEASASRNVFTLNLSAEQAYAIERQETVIFAVRPITKDEDTGGTSGQTAKVSSITPTAVGIWTSRSNTVSTSGTDFQQHQTANAILYRIERSGKEMNTFTTGTAKAIGAFTFEARKNSDGNPALQTLSFSVSAPSEVLLSTVSIRGNDSDTSHSCTVASATITCSSIPSSIGSLQSLRIITVYADIALSSSHPDPFLQIELNQPSRPGSPGAITWTDGVTSFTWVPFDSPVAQGTLWK